MTYTDNGIKTTVKYPPSLYSMQFCKRSIAILVLDFFQFALCLGWMIWLAIAANRVQGMRPGKAYHVPAHKLVMGEVEVPGAAVTGGAAAPVPVPEGLSVPVRPEMKRAGSDSTGFVSAV